MSALGKIARFLLSVLMPLVVIVVGAGIAAAGFHFESQAVIVAGLLVMGAGLLWGFLSFGSVLDL